MDARNNSQMGKGPRHTPYQNQQLEAFFEECPNPTDDQKNQLCKKLGLNQEQIKFGFQNRRNQKKIQNDRVENAALHAENEKLQYENLAFSEVLKNVKCQNCDDHPPVGDQERNLNIEKLRSENALMREEYERIANEISSRTGKPIAHLLSIPPESLDRVVIEEYKTMMVQKADHALNELAELVLTMEPLWVMSPTYGGYVLHDENYSNTFPKSSHLIGRNSRIESSKDMVVVPIAASDLVEMFIDMRKRADLFPTIVMEAKILETFNNENLNGSLHLMYERTHILSSLVAPREFVFLRYCKQMGRGTWFIVDASCDSHTESQNMLPTNSWMFPSGLMIESLSGGNSKVTWVDHVEIDESLTDPLYRDLLSSLHGYGAKRWISTLDRMIERPLYSFSPAITSSPELEEGLSTVEGRRNTMALSCRMIKEFCAILSMPERSDLSESASEKVKISVRDNNEPGEPHCVIVAASTSVWLPLTFETIFSFLRDQSRRSEWDLVLNRSPVDEIAHLLTGTHPGNGISIIKPWVSNKQNKLLIQENSIDSLGAFVVFASIDSDIFQAVMNGDDSGKIPILPCGFIISADRGPTGEGSGGASSSTGIRSKPSGSLVTLAFQISVEDNSGKLQIQKEAANNLTNLVISIIQNLKVVFGCIHLD